MTNLNNVSVGVGATAAWISPVMVQPEAMRDLMTKTKKGNALDQTI